MNILTVDTGNEKLDSAYKKMQVHIVAYDRVDEFVNYFSTITKEVDRENLAKWLMKVLFWEFKYGRVTENGKQKTENGKSDWEVFLDVCSDEERVKLEAWLRVQMSKKGVYRDV